MVATGESLARVVVRVVALVFAGVCAAFVVVALDADAASALPLVDTETVSSVADRTTEVVDSTVEPAVETVSTLPKRALPDVESTVEQTTKVVAAVPKAVPPIVENTTAPLASPVVTTLTPVVQRVDDAVSTVQQSVVDAAAATPVAVIERPNIDSSVSTPASVQTERKHASVPATVAVSGASEVATSAPPVLTKSLPLTPRFADAPLRVWRAGNKHVETPFEPTDAFPASPLTSVPTHGAGSSSSSGASQVFADLVCVFRAHSPCSTIVTSADDVVPPNRSPEPEDWPG